MSEPTNAEELRAEQLHDEYEDADCELTEEMIARWLADYRVVCVGIEPHVLREVSARYEHTQRQLRLALNENLELMDSIYVVQTRCTELLMALRMVRSLVQSKQGMLLLPGDLGILENAVKAIDG